MGRAASSGVDGPLRRDAGLRSARPDRVLQAPLILLSYKALKNKGKFRQGQQAWHQPCNRELKQG